MPTRRRSLRVCCSGDLWCRIDAVAVSLAAAYMRALGATLAAAEPWNCHERAALRPII